MKKIYLVFDPEDSEYEAFSTYKEALRYARTDIGKGGCIPFNKMFVVKVLAEVKEAKKLEPIVTVIRTN